MSIKSQLQDLPGARVLWSPRRLQTRIHDTVVGLIDSRYHDSTNRLVVVGILNGAEPLFRLVEHIVPALRAHVEFDTIGSQLYADGVRPQGTEPIITKNLDHALAGADVLLVEDILDTGLTLKKITADCRAARARSIRVLVLCRRSNARARRDQRKNFPSDIPVSAIFEYRSARFLVGFGLDYGGRYRDLSYVAAFTPPDNQ